MVLLLPLWHKSSNNTMHLQSKLNARTLRNEHMFALNVIFRLYCVYVRGVGRETGRMLELAVLRLVWSGGTTL